MEPIHIKFNFEEAVTSRKFLLSTQINLLSIIKNINNYIILRKKEFLLKQKLKGKIIELNKKLNSAKKAIPKTKSPEKEKQEIQETIKKEKIKQNLEIELERIKEKLEILNQLNQ